MAIKQATPKEINVGVSLKTLVVTDVWGMTCGISDAAKADVGRYGQVRTVQWSDAEKALGDNPSTCVRGENDVIVFHNPECSPDYFAVVARLVEVSENPTIIVGEPGVNPSAGHVSVMSADTDAAAIFTEIRRMTPPPHPKEEPKEEPEKGGKKEEGTAKRKRKPKAEKGEETEA
jgi:hypothetical protein